MADLSRTAAGKAVHGHTAELARRRLRDAILDGTFAPGAVMTQSELAETLDVGRTPLREAIRVVQEEGLLVSQPNRKVRVAGFSMDDLEELYVLRILVDAAAVRATVPELTPEDVGELRALMTKMEHFAADGDFERYSVPHRAFHMALIAAQGERALVFSSQLFDHSARYRQAYVASEVDAYLLPDQEHRAMLDAAVARDAAACAQELVAHYVRTVAGVIQQLDPGAEMPRLRTACAVALGAPDADASAALWARVLGQRRAGA